ncbi:ribonuclease domain-containing protein [Actinomadura sp. NEAU-AAG7]|uniref:ribonuclease domain-containing protein n=1 Tax=Actinomadura sp. NEAU-AAG7 TaxID=2839640 RepID=UPI001BE415F4|nr:ribonuclease domain-containing protein [Actinomadura sp. NEAU-AAG7]MBT2206603.1 hypothetical protein [Actinomadura sp. NEAU-AAG7]
MLAQRAARWLTPLAAAALITGAAPAASSAPTRPAPSAPASESWTRGFPMCSNPPTAIARWWKRNGWVRNGDVNKQYRMDEGGRVAFIWGGRTYKNVSTPRLPSYGTYNEYDVHPSSRPNAPRDSHRLVRRLRGGNLYYTADHYRSFCYIGAGW